MNVFFVIASRVPLGKATAGCERLTLTTWRPTPGGVRYAPGPGRCLALFGVLLRVLWPGGQS